MSISGNNLFTLMNQKMQWTGKRAQVLVSNLARAEMKDVRRSDLKPFAECISRKDRFKKANIYQEGTKFNQADIIETNEEISRESEIFEITRNANENEAITNIFKKLLHMLKSAGAKIQ